MTTYKDISQCLFILLIFIGSGHPVSVLALNTLIERQESISVIPQNTPIIVTKAQQQTTKQTSQQYNQGIEQFKKRQFRKALQSFQAALSQFKQQGNQAQVGATLERISETYKELAEHGLSLQSAQEALTIAQKLQDRQLEGLAFTRIAYAQSNLGFSDQAIAAAETGLKIGKELNNPKIQVFTLIVLSYEHSNVTEKAKALDYANQAVSIAKKSQETELEVKSLDRLGNFYRYSEKHYSQALKIYQQALEIAKSANYVSGQIFILSNIYTTYSEIKNDEQSLVYRQERLKVAQEIGDSDTEAYTLQDIGNLYEGKSQPKPAEEAFLKSLVVAQNAQDPQLEASVLTNLGDFYQDRRDFTKTFDYYQQSLAISKRLDRQKNVMITLNKIGDIHKSLNDYPKAIKFYQQALPIARSIKQRDWEAGILNDIANSYYSQRNYQQAITYYQQSLPIFQELQKKQDESTLLTNIGDAYGELKDYQQKLDYYQKAIAVDRKMKNSEYEVTDLINLAAVYAENIKDSKTAIQYYQQALKIAQNGKDRNFERTTLMSLGYGYSSKLNDDKQGIVYHEQALQIAREQKRPDLASILSKIARHYIQRGHFEKVVAWGKEGLALAKQQKDIETQGFTLLFLGSAYNLQSQFSQAIEYFQEALTIARSTENRGLEEATLVNLGFAYALGENRNQEGLKLLQQGLTLARELKDSTQESIALSTMSGVYRQINDYTKAIDIAKQSLTLSRKIGNDKAELYALSSLQISYQSLGDLDSATKYATQVLELSRKTNSRLMEGLSLMTLGDIALKNNDIKQAIDLANQATAIKQESPFLEIGAIALLSSAYKEQGNYEKAIELQQQILVKAQSLKSQSLISSTLSDLGYYYRKAGQFEKAITYYQESLTTNPTPDIPGSNSDNYTGLGRAYRSLGKPQVAIAYYKKAVDQVEEFRRTIQGLPPELQNSFLQKGKEGEKTVDIYRELAALLLSEKRVAEAQNVLELLKNQEIKDFQRGGEGTSTVSKSTPPSNFSDTEKEILKQNGTLIAFGRKVAECKVSQCTELSKLNEQLQGLNQQYVDKIANLRQEFRNRNDEALLDPSNKAKMKEVVDAQPGTVLIYPFVTENKIWLIWASQGGLVKEIEVPVSKKQLQETVSQFRVSITNRLSKPDEYQRLGKQLYDWLIKPIESELKNNKIQNLVFSLDGSTRYIPMAALFDGKQYLIENYRISTVSASTETNMGDRLPTDYQKVRVLGLGASEFKDLKSLPNVPEEINAIVKQNPTDKKGIFPGLKFLNQKFDLPALRDHLTQTKILHIATHAAFVNGQPEESYLVLGTGKKYTLREIAAIPDLDQVHLVVLSACQTAMGGKAQDGIEIAGISSYFMKGGTKAVIASLWSVDDASTSKLMQELYQNLAKNTANKSVTKAEALRQAQLSLLHSDKLMKFSHPYYWSPFILIGNNL
jgi:CHAT domain-containing protein/Flp pilus assembly protein TadD